MTMPGGDLAGVPPVTDDGETTVSAVFVAYHTPMHMLRGSVSSFTEAATHAGIGAEVLIVDNGGFDRESAADDWVVVTMPGNVGFGHAVNAAVEQARGQFTILMNPDSKLDPHALTVLMAAQTPGREALWGCLLLNDGRPQVHAYNLWWFSTQILAQKASWKDQLRRQIDAGEPVKVDRLCGAGLFARTRILRDLGPFQDDFFLYGEDVDLSLRAQTAGYECVLLPRAVVHHDAGTSSIGASALVERARTDAHFRLLAHHRSRWMGMAARLESVLVTAAGSVRVTGEVRAARLSRLREIRRWGAQAMAPRFNPTIH